MKKIILIIVLLLLLVPGYFLYQTVRRNMLLNSGDSVLLINKSEGLYTFTDYINMEVDASLIEEFKVIDRVESINDEEFAKITEGLTLFGTKKILETADVIVDLPQGESLAAWNEVLDTLQPEIKNLCASIPQADQGQQCLARHAIKQFHENGTAATECEKLFPEYIVKECENILESGELGSITDTDSNQLIDLYEFYAFPESFDANPQP